MDNSVLLKRQTVRCVIAFPYVREFTYLDDRVCAGGGCEAAVTARARCGLVKYKECGELPYGRIFLLWLKEVLCMSYVGPSILYGSEAWCLVESEI